MMKLKPTTFSQAFDGKKSKLVSYIKMHTVIELSYLRGEASPTLIRNVKLYNPG
jgi:hypothetical protein